MGNREAKLSSKAKDSLENPTTAKKTETKSTLKEMRSRSKWLRQSSSQGGESSSQADALRTNPEASKEEESKKKEIDETLRMLEGGKRSEEPSASKFLKFKEENREKFNKRDEEVQQDAKETYKNLTGES